MPAELICFEERCRARFPVTEVIYNCPRCGGLLESTYPGRAADPEALKRLWRERRTSNAPLDQSGVWRYREIIPFLDSFDRVVTLREGNTPLLEAPRAAAYASAAGLQPIIFIPHGNISYGKLAQALEYGARTFQVEANFDQILALVRTLAERLGIYLLNSINPFRIEGQKTIIVEMMDQRDWNPPDWIVLPGGNLGNTSAFGKALREMLEMGLIRRSPRLAVIQAAGSAPFYNLVQSQDRGRLTKVEHPETLATAIRIGDPVSWPKALHEVTSSGGVVEKVTEQEIADAKAQIGLCGIGCEPASAATLAGIRKLRAAGVIAQDADVVAVLTGNLLKDPDYIYRYHTGQLTAPDGAKLNSTFGNHPVVVPNDADKIAALLQ